MTQGFDRRALDILAGEVNDLMWRVHRAQEMVRQVERADDEHALRNFIVLSPYANPECLPPFARRIPGGQLPLPASAPQRPLPQGVPSPRRSPEAS